MHILRYVNYSSNHALISIFSVCGCGTIKVTLSQKAQTTITLPNLQGLYEESATVNGRSSWISTNKLYAIWYHPDFKDWMMGLSKEIGTRWLVHFSLAFLKSISRSAHQTPNFTNPELKFPQFKVLQNGFFLFNIMSYIGILECILILV